MKHHLRAGLAILAISAVLTGCAGGTGTTTETTPAATPDTTATATTDATPSATASAAVDLMTASSSEGEIVVDSKGMSLYFFTKDVKDSGTSACTEGCLKAWPPLFTTSDTPTAEGVTGELGTIDTPDGKKQVTLNGMPLYYFEKDTKPGDILGQGVNDVWYLSDPAGEMIKTGGAG